MDGANTFGESKKTLADNLYRLLDEEVCDMAAICDIGEFSGYFAKVLEDYSLVLKNGIIE